MSFSCFGMTFMVGGMLKFPPIMNIAPKHEMLIFWLCLTSDDWLSNPSYKSHQKCENNGCQIILLHFWQLSLLRWLSWSSEVESNAKMSMSCFGATFMVGGMLKWTTMNITPKNKMLIFGLCLTSDNQLSNLSYKSHQKCKNNGCQIILLHFWQLSLLIWLGWSSEVESNPKMSFSCFGAMFMVGGMLKWTPTMNITPKNKMLISGLCLTSDDQPSNLSYKNCQKCENNGCQIILLHFWQLSLLRWLGSSSEVIFKFSSVLIIA